MKRLQFTPKMLAVMGVLIALKVVIAQFVTFRPAQSIKLSLDFIPIVIAGILYGPAPALIISILADVLGALRNRGWENPEVAVSEGLSAVKWPARLEVLHRAPLFLLDGGHNPQCAKALAESLDSLLPGQAVIFLTGVLADKDYGSMFTHLLPHAREFVCVTADSPRRLTAGKLSAYLRSRGAKTEVCDSVASGISRALELSSGSCPVVAFGSLYLAEAVRGGFPRLMKRYQRQICLGSRLRLTQAQRKEYSEIICRRLTELPCLRAARTVFSYCATEGEVNLEDFHRWAVSQGKRLAFPVTRGGGVMEARVPRDDKSWETGGYGIPAPIPERSVLIPPEQIDAILIPCVGFDANGGRLGHGGGYYDRYLAACPDAARVCAAFEAQRLEAVARESTDLPMGAIVTEELVYLFAE